MPSKDDPIFDEKAVGQMLARYILDSEEQNTLPVLDEQGMATGETYDRRLGTPANQPDPNRLTIHLQYLESKFGGGQVQPGKPIPGVEPGTTFNPVDPWQSSGVLDSLKNMYASGYGQSLTGQVETFLGKLGIGDEIADAFGLIDQNKIEAWQPSKIEEIGSQVASFLSPLDLLATATGAGAGAKLASFAGRAGLKSVAGKLGTRILQGAGGLGNYEMARGFFEGYNDDQKSALKEAAAGLLRGATTGAVLSLAGGVVPEKLLKSKTLGSVGTLGAEIATFGTFEPFLEGRAPTADDYINAGGFLVGMRLAVGGFNLIPKAFGRKAAAEAEKVRKIQEEKGITANEAFDVRANQIIRENPDQFNVKAYEKLTEVAKQGREGEVVKIKDLFSGDLAQSVYRKFKNFGVAFKKDLGDGVAGAADYGNRKIYLNPDMIAKYPDKLPFTIAHELAHLEQSRKGQAVVTKEGAPKARAERMADIKGRESLETIVRAKENMPPVRPERAFRDKVNSEKTVEIKAKEADKIPPSVKTDVNKFDGKAEAYRFQSGEGPNDMAVMAVMDKGKGHKTLSIIDIRGKDKMSALREAIKTATKNKDRIYYSKNAESTAWFKEAETRGMVGERVGRYLRAKVATIPKKEGLVALPPGAGFTVRPKTIYDARTLGGRVVRRPAQDAAAKEKFRQDVALAQGRRKAMAVATERMIQRAVEEGKVVPPETLLRFKNKQWAKDALKKFDDQGKILPKRTLRQEALPGETVKEKSSWLLKRAGAVIRAPYAEKKAVAGKAVPSFIKQPKNRFSSDQGREYVERLANADVVRGNTIGELMDKAVSIVSKTEGKTLEDIQPALFNIKKSRMSQEAGERLSDSIRQGKEPVWTEFFNYVAERVKQYEPDFKPLKNYLPQVLKRKWTGKIVDDLEAIQKRLDEIGEATKGSSVAAQEKAILDMIATKSTATKDFIYHLTESGLTLKQAVSQLRQFTTAQYANVPWFLKRRRIHFEDGKIPENLKQYYENDARVIIPRYVDSVSRWIAENEAFGKNNKKLESLLMKMPEQEAELALKVFQIWNGQYDLIHGPRGAFKKVVDAFVGFNVGTKIGLGQGTILNLSQPLISIVPDLGVFNTIRGGLSLLNKDVRAEIRRSGAVSRHAAEAITMIAGYAPEGAMGQFAQLMTRVSGFRKINRANQYLAAATIRETIPQWIKQARGSGRKAEWARKRLKDFNIDYTKEITDANLAKSMFRFAMDSQLQKNVLADPVFLNTPYGRALFLFKRFGIRQALYMKDMLVREGKRGNWMPLIRLAAGGMLGGAASVWGLNKIKSAISGEPLYRKDDSIADTILTNVAHIGALGMLSDVMAAQDLTRVMHSLKFAVLPVAASDAEQIYGALDSIAKDWKRYGDGWFALERNLDDLAGPLGTFPRKAFARAKYPSQKENKYKFLKGKEKDDIFQLILDGDGEAAANRIAKWNENIKLVPIRMHEVSASALYDYVARKAKAYAEAKGLDAQEQRRIERQRRQELLKKLRENSAEVLKYQKLIATGS